MTEMRATRLGGSPETSFWARREGTAIRRMPSSPDSWLRLRGEVTRRSAMFEWVMTFSSPGLRHFAACLWLSSFVRTRMDAEGCERSPVCYKLDAVRCSDLWSA